MSLHVRLTPGASSDRVDGWGVDASGRPYLAVRVRARPIEGRANAALEALLAERLNIARSRVRVDKGATGRLKRIELEGVSAGELAAAFGTGDT